MSTATTGVKKVSLLTATCIVIANMVGTGIFTSLGFQVADLSTGFSVVVLWLLGGVCALCGALSYGELAAALPRSGGEYHFLGRIYHPAVGFLSGWLSATVGFAAPVAIAAMAFGSYLYGAFPGLPAVAGIQPERWLALTVVAITTVPLLFDLALSSAFQNSVTLLKVALILTIIAAGFLAPDPQPISFLASERDRALILSAPFAVSLFWVMYAYSGWNASTYIAGEVRDPSRTIPLSVALGTGVVIVLYLLVNMAFLRVTPIVEMAGRQQVALIASQHLFGEAGAQVMTAFICIGLLSPVNAMMWIGPRVTVAMGEDLGGLRWLARKSADGVPIRATLVQFAIVIGLLFTASFETAVNYVQFSLTLASALTVAGVFVLRWREPDLPRPYRTWGYPFTPLLFLGISTWMMWYMLQVPKTRGPSLWGLLTIALGLIVYFLSRRRAPAHLEP